MKNGIYALASLDGRPLDRRDLAVIGLAEDGAGVRAARDCLVLPQDVRASAIHSRSGPDGIDTLLGDLDEPAEAARALGLAATADPLTIVLGTVERFGDRAPARLLGTWILVRWDARRATMTLLMAERARDACYVATDGRYVALSPDLVRLARLGWVDAAPDPANLLLSVARARLRHALGSRTFLRDVVRVMPGTRVTVCADGMRTDAAEPARAPVPAASVRFDEAVEAIDGIMRRIMRQHFAREGDSALALSGGLDSSILALYAAQERGDRGLTFLTSVAPPGSGLADESGFAAAVAAHLGVPLENVSPPPTASVYRPSDRMFAAAETPLLSARHYLDEALQQAALDAGAGVLLDGSGGEMTITNHGDHAGPRRPLRALARRVRDRLRVPRGVGGQPGHFHVRLSPGLLDSLPFDPAATLHEQAMVAHRPGRHDPLGVDDVWALIADVPDQAISATLRERSPFFDRRLIRYAAALPAGFTWRGGTNRALGRQLVEGVLPDDVTRRRRGLPYSPNYLAMIREQASDAGDRLHDIGTADIAAWIDLEWVRKTLPRTQAVEKMELLDVLQLQASLIFVEFLVWWGERVNRPPHR